jgi:NADH-quinone oxidoreductase subunit I
MNKDRKLHPYGKKMTFWESLYIGEIFRGMGITIKHVIRNIFHTSEMPTVQYPEEHYEYSDRFRGRHRLMKREDGTPRCVACMMCSTACPADCIHIKAGEHRDDTIEKFPETFEIDLLRCVYCGLCEEACPCDAIRMDTGIYEIAADSRDKFYVDKEFLLNDKSRGTL